MPPPNARVLALACAFLWPGAQPSRAADVPLCVATSDQVGPAVVSDGAGGAIIVWEDSRNGNADIYAQHLLGSGEVDPAWPVNGLAVCSAGGTQRVPVIAADGAGGAIVAWQDNRVLSLAPQVFAQRVLASGVVDPAWPLDGRALCPLTPDQLQPAIVPDGSGGAIVGWSDARAGSLRDVYAQHVLSSGEVDPAWPAAGLAVCLADRMQLSPAMASDGAGGAFLAWEDERDVLVAGSDIYAHHILASGIADPAWPVQGRALCTATESQRDPVLVAEGAGGAIAAWEDFRDGTPQNPDWNLYAQRVLASGDVDPAWPANGRSLCAANGNQRDLDLVRDGAGGAIAVWIDARGADLDVYAQHVLIAGSVDPNWPADGRALCTAAGDQIAPRMVVDDAGGAIAGWHDFRNDSLPDIYAQRVMASGAVDPGWPANGVAISVAAGRQQFPVLASDGAHGAILAWQDRRSGAGWDIYAGLTSTAVAGVPIPAPREGLWLESPRPNPARTQAVLRFALPGPGRVRLSLHDVSGRRVRTLFAGECGAGPHSLPFDLADESRRPLPGGLYLVTLQYGTRTLTAQLVALR